MMTEPPHSDRDWTTADDVSWTLLDRNELADAYRAVVAPALRADGFDPDTHKPTYDWLRENGFRSLLYALREYHDRTFDTFWTDDLGLSECDDGYEWSTDHDETIDALDAFLDSKRDRAGLDESSVQTLQYRLDHYLRAYRAVNATDDLLSPIAPETETTAREATGDCWSAFDRLDDQLDAPATKRRIHLVVSNWYDHLVRRRWADVNPARGIDDEYGWSDADRGTGDTPCLSADHVRGLFETAEDSRERLLVVALAAWGLRPNGVASLHVSQFDFDGDVATIAFEERKNGPGEVSVLFGREVFDARVDELGEREDWMGYLFPSPHANSDHITRQTVANWFDDLGDRSGLPDAIEGESVSAKLCRRFWYDAYTSALDVVLSGIDEIASEQGSADPEVVLDNYLSEQRRRQARRDAMRDALADAFET